MEQEEKNSIARRWFAHVGFQTSTRKLAKEKGVSHETVRNIVRHNKPKTYCVCCGCPAHNMRLLKDHYKRMHPFFRLDWLTNE